MLASFIKTANYNQKKRENMPSKIKKPEKFNVVKAVKSNARDRVGIIPAEKVFKTRIEKDEIRPKHKKSVTDLIQEDDD